MHPLIKSTINSYTASIWTARSVKRHTANNGLAPELRGKELIRSTPDQIRSGIGQRNLAPTFQIRPFFRFQIGKMLHHDNIICLTRQPIGRLCTRSESCGKGYTYEYIRRIHDNSDHRSFNRCNSESEK